MYESVRMMFSVDAQKDNVVSLVQSVYEIVFESNSAFQESMERKAEERRREEAERIREAAQTERSPEVVIDVRSMEVDTTPVASASTPEGPARGDVVDVNA